MKGPNHPQLYFAITKINLNAAADEYIVNGVYQGEIDGTDWNGKAGAVDLSHIDNFCKSWYVVNEIKIAFLLV